MYSNTMSLFKGKPFFMPWQSSDVPFDALLGLSLTLNTDKSSPSVFLETYEKTPGRLRLSLSMEGIPLVAIDHVFSKGIEVVELPTSELLTKGMITVTDSSVVESPTKLPIQLSPLYINTVRSEKTTNKCYFNEQVAVMTNLNIAGAVDVDVNATEDTGIINIAYADRIVSTSDFDKDYITRVNGKPVNKDGYAVIDLPTYFGLHPDATGSTLNMTGNTDDTCTVYTLRSPEILLQYIKKAGYSEPFDPCGSGVNFNPRGIDDMLFTDELLKWDELSRRHE